MLQFTPEFFSPEEFINRYRSLGGFRNHRISDVLRDALAIIPHIKNIYTETSSDIPIRISNSTNLSAESNPYSIVLSLGMIEHCIAAPCMPIDEICPAVLFITFDYSSLAAIALAWVIAHEYFHIVKRHNEVAIAALELTDKPYENSIDNALEHDADLMAVAAIYRLMQMRLGGMIHDMDVRRITIYSIFFTLRTFPQGSADDVHSAMPERLFHIYHKLVWLTKKPGEEFSATGLTDYSRERADPLLQAFAQCEEYFQVTGGKNEYNLIKLFSEFGNNKKALEIVESWHWIRPTVEKITGVESNKKHYKASTFNPICIFCGANNPISVPMFAPWITTKLSMVPHKQTLDYSTLAVFLADGSANEIPSQPYVRESMFGTEKIERICASCKNDWFDPLDSAVRPLLEKLIDGEKPAIYDNDAKLISIYMCIIAVLQEYTDPNPDNRHIPAPYKKKLRKNKIPLDWVVAIRPIEKSSGYGIWSRFLSAADRTGYTICSIHLGCFYAQLVCLIDFDYPIYFDRSKFIVTNPPRGQSDLGKIQVLDASKLNETIDILHALMMRWGSDKLSEAHGKK